MRQNELEALYHQRTREREQALTHMRSILQLVASWEARRIEEIEPLLVRLRAAMAALDDSSVTSNEEGEQAQPERNRYASMWPAPLEDEPDLDQIGDWIFDSVCEATDGCTVEPDGVCPHGYPSWLLYLGLV